jgi:transglutaminase-like putative cysteine protease
MITDERLAPGGAATPAPTGSPAASRTRARRPSRRPAPVTSDHLLATAALLGLTLVTAIGMCRVFADWTFLSPMLEMAIGVHLIALLLRVLRVPAAIALPFTVVAVYELVALLFYRDTMRFWLPSHATLESLRLDLRLVWKQFPTAVAPVTSAGGYLVGAAVALGLVAVLADAFAFRAYGRAEAVVPSGVMFVFTAALGTSRNRIGVTAAWLGAALVVVALLRALHGGSDESWLGRRSRAMRAALPPAAGFAVAAALVAAIAGPQVPGAGSKALLDTRHHTTDVTEVLSPLVDIRSRLVNRTNVQMFTVEAATPRYWRVTGLSQFDGTTWGLPERTLEAASNDLNDLPRGARVIQQHIVIDHLGDRLIPAAFAPLRISERGVHWLSGTDTLVNDAASFKTGDVFDVASVDLDPNADQLRAASVTSPPGNEFLDLPASFPDEVREIAASVTVGAATPYDQMIALQNWFQHNFTYDLNVQAGHSDDAILSFLRIKRGYCEQFSATMAAMARSLGVPARVAVGFTQGNLGSDGKYHVLGKHAHAWPEIWFDGIGWVAFEPTPGRGAPGSESSTGLTPAQDDSAVSNGNGGGPAEAVPVTTARRVTPTTERGEGGPSKATTVPSTAPPTTLGSSSHSSSNPMPWILLALVALGAWAVAMPVLMRRFVRRGSTPSERVITAWHGTVGALELAGAPFANGATPIEYALNIERELPIDHRALSELARFVTRAVYAPTGVTEPVAMRASVLQVQLQRSATDLMPWYTRALCRIDPRLARQRLVGTAERAANA